MWGGAERELKSKMDISGERWFSLVSEGKSVTPLLRIGGVSDGRRPRAPFHQPRCFDCPQIGHKQGDAVCPKKPPTGGAEGRACLSVPQLGSGTRQKPVIPDGGSCHLRQITVNGVPVMALRETCASLTMTVARLFSPVQYLPGQMCRVAHGLDLFHPMALESMEWGGAVTQRKVTVSPQMSIDYILGN